MPRLNESNIRTLQQYDWPGNIRELQNVVERAVIVAHGGRVHFDLPSESARPVPGEVDTAATAAEAIITDDEMRLRERENILAALRQAKWKISGDGGAAQLLGIKPTTLSSRMKKLEIERPL